MFIHKLYTLTHNVGHLMGISICSVWAFADKAHDPARSRTHTDTHTHTGAKVGHSCRLTCRVMSMSSLVLAGQLLGKQKQNMDVNQKSGRKRLRICITWKINPPFHLYFLDITSSKHLSLWWLVNWSVLKTDTHIRACVITAHSYTDWEADCFISLGLTLQEE